MEEEFTILAPLPPSGPPFLVKKKKKRRKIEALCAHVKYVGTQRKLLDYLPSCLSLPL